MSIGFYIAAVSLAFFVLGGVLVARGMAEKERRPESELDCAGCVVMFFFGMILFISVFGEFVDTNGDPSFENITYVNETADSAERVYVLQKKMFKRTRIYEYMVMPGQMMYLQNSKIVSVRKIDLDI